MKEEKTWIPLKDKMPTKPGKYKIKTIHGEYEAFVSNTATGRLIWVIPDESIITHWQTIKK